MSEPKVLEERYLGAVRSSHLRMNMERSGDVDVLVAAGWVRESLATELYRLRAEFDMAKGNVRLETANYRALQKRARDQQEIAVAQRARDKFGPTLAAWHELRADALLEQAEQQANTGRALIMTHLKSLNGVLQALHNFGEAKAPRMGYYGINVPAVTSHALDLILDPLCAHCSGVGFFGGYGKPRTLCGKCRGSTKRRVDFGSIEAQAFGIWLMADLERKLARVDSLMLRFLSRGRGGADAAADDAPITSPEAELKARLADLRGVAANVD